MTELLQAGWIQTKCRKFPKGQRKVTVITGCPCQAGLRKARFKLHVFSKDAKIKAANSQLDRGTLLRLSLRATRGARNPNLQVLLRMRRKYVASISFGLPEWMECTERNLITCVLTISHLRTVMEQKRFDLWSLSPALRILWLLRLYKLILLFSGSQSTSGDPPWRWFLSQLISLFRSLYCANEKDPLSTS